MDIQAKIEQLRKEIGRHDHLYYVLNSPELSDRQYDRLYKELVELEATHREFITPDSPTQRVSGRPVSSFEQVAHLVPMLSMDNTYNSGELREFDARVRKALGVMPFSYVVELKIDGLAVSIVYRNGAFQRAATRGDGDRGDDVSLNVRTIRSLPLKLHLADPPEVVEVRGEVYMSQNAFDKTNAQRQTEGKQLFANPRNAAAGSLKLLNPAEVSKRELSFFCYGVANAGGWREETHYQTLMKLKNAGLPVNPNIERAKSIDEVIDICMLWDTKRKELGYPTDGMVIKVDQYQAQEALGATGRSPRWCIAYKFAAEQAQTRITSVDVQVGKTGILTPVANLEPVSLAGTTVKRASLHNFDEVARLGVRVGDTVIIEKAGEIIPQVVEVLPDLRPAESEEILPPSTCPICHSAAVKDESGVYVRCSNKACPAMLRQRLIYFVGKGQMNIDSLGPALVDQLIDSGLVEDFADIYRLTEQQLLSLERIKEKSAARILESIEKSRKAPLWRFITALGIRHIGSQSAEVLSNHFKTIDAIMNANNEELEAIDQIGPTLAQSIVEYFSDTQNIELIKKLLDSGVKLFTEETSTSPLAGYTYVVTGSLSKFTRTEIREFISSKGGKVSSSISAKTDFLVAGENSGSKLDKAQKLGVKIITEAQLLQMCDEDTDLQNDEHDGKEDKTGMLF